MMTTYRDTYILEELEREADVGLPRYKLIFRYLIDELSQGNRLHLYSLFSKIAYLDGKIDFSESELRALHFVRKFIEDGNSKLTAKAQVAFEFSIRKLLFILNTGLDFDSSWAEYLQRWEEQDQQAYTVQSTTEFIRAAITHADHDTHTLVVFDAATGMRCNAKFNITEVNELFNKSIEHLETRINLPVVAHFIDNRFISEHEFIPSAIIIDPDFLVDVTAVAESFTPDMELPLAYLVKQLAPKSNSPHLLLGNIANQILDRFMLEKPVEYEELMKESFKQFALSFSLLSNEEVSMLSTQTKQLLTNLFQDVRTLKKENQDAIAYIEPAFVSGRFGIQGRLDALFLDTEFKSGKIVELKSGKPYRENEFGLSRNHYVQTLLYDLLIKSAFGDSFQSVNYILYCKLMNERLRQAPTIKHVQFEALKVRNDIVAINHHLMQRDHGASFLFRFDHAIYSKAGGFIFKDAQQLFSITRGLTIFERTHLCHFMSLIAMENYVAKVGGAERQKRMGFSSLWQADAEEKEAEFNIFRKLKIGQGEEEGVYNFDISEKNKLTNFRKGDIVILYPASREKNPIDGQLLKGSILNISQNSIKIRLRNELIRKEVFESIEFWNAEHDFIESSMRNSMRSLFAFYQTNDKRRSVLLGLQKPQSTANELSKEFLPELTEKQRHLLQEMINAEDYYLLWGPPGTGKTSVMLAAFVQYVMTNTDDTLLLVAYTNRAVDEICDVLNRHYPDQFTRIGSRFSVAERMKSTLLQTKLTTLKNRKEVKRYIDNCRIFVGTQASISGKDELFKVKKFDCMVVDEASQILEPQLLGLAGRVGRSILIGDHKQLPAVVTTSADHTQIDDELLLNAGFKDLSFSLFERLMRTCDEHGWNNAIGRLDKQGRMHREIGQFVSQHFYSNELKVVDHIPRLVERQTRGLNKFYVNGFPEIRTSALDQRLHCIHVEQEGIDQFQLLKMSEKEAEMVVETVISLLTRIPEDATIGVICPFRAQIALIKHKLEVELDVWPECLSIDTVERYQGSARDIIIISSCAANQRTFQAIQSIDTDGVDRKLNVALSRSREQLILFGDHNILSRNDVYRELISYADQLT